MSTVKTYGFIEKGKLKILNKNRFAEQIKQQKDCDVQIIVKKKGKRSIQQNRYYFGVVIEEIRLNLLDRGNRFDADTIHEFLKSKFNYEAVIIEETGERLEIGQTTTEMNKIEFGVYLDRIIEWASQTLELVIPLPNEQMEFKM